MAEGESNIKQFLHSWLGEYIIMSRFDVNNSYLFKELISMLNLTMRCDQLVRNTGKGFSVSSEFRNLTMWLLAIQPTRRMLRVILLEISVLS